MYNRTHLRKTPIIMSLIFLLILAFSLPISADLLEIDNTAPAGFNETTNPYGYKTGDPFPLVVKNEVAFYGGHVGTTDLGLKNTDSTSDLNTLIKNALDATGKEDYSNPGSNYSYVQAIAMDGDGDGRKNHVVFVGLDTNTYKAVAWVVDMDSSDKKASAAEELGPMNWIKDGNYKQYSSTSLFAITAGDYDNDGKDSVVVAIPLDYTTSGYYGSRLYEFTVDTYYNSLTERGYSTKHLPYDQYRDILDKSDSGSTCRNKLGISLASGDFNGDFVDDLAVLSYRHVLTSTNVNKSFYDPSLVIVYRTGWGENAIDSEYYERLNLMTVSGSSATFPMACTLTAGNWDNDDCEDLAVVGVIGSATLNGSNISGQISVSDGEWYVQRIYGDSGNAFVKEGYHKVGANEWFKDGFYTSDNCYGRVMAEGFALNGDTNPDMLFISGSLYDISGNSPVYKGQNDYFDSGDEGLSMHTASNTFMQSTAVGNFIGDEAGREQVIYTVGMKRNGHDQYYYKAGYVCGKNYNDTDSSYGLATGYTFSSVDDDSSYIFEATEDHLSYELNCSFIAVDYGDDSVYAKYLGKQYAYSDPTVSMVLQAAPYFSEVSGPGSSWTEYILSTSYGTGDTGSGSLAASLGVSAGGGIPGIANVSATLQYACSRTESWEDSVTTTTSQSFVATTYDSVVVNRIPVFIYQYDVLDENGNWQNGPVMELMSPRPAVYESLSVDAYNEFAETYNAQMATKSSDFNRLETIDKAANYLDNNEGNPYAYNLHGWGDTSVNATQISSTPISLGTNNALGRVAWTEENTHTDSWETTNGFHFDFTALFGPETFGAGVSGSIDYDKGYGETTTTGTAVGAACSVQDIDGPSLSAAGMPLNVIESFGFDWTFGRWERHLSGDKDSKTPFIGYALTNVTSPPLSVKDLTASSGGNDTIHLSWSKPIEKGNWPEIIGYDIYTVDDFGTYTKVGSRLSSDAESASVTGLSPFAEYTFVLVSVAKSGGNEVNSVWSNEASARTTTKPYTLTFGADDEKAAAVTATTLGGTAVTSGATVNAGQIVNISATAKDENSTILGIEIDNGTEVTTIAPAADGRSAKVSFPMTANTNVTVLTDRTLTSAEVTFKADYDGGTLAASVYGVNLAAPGGVVSAPVTFTATPAEGYYLKAWQITANGTTVTMDAAKMNPFTLELKYETVYVEAVFEKTSAATAVITVEQPAEGGTIELTDESGKVIALNDSNSATVAYGSAITATAKPLTGYVFTAWTGDAAAYTASSFTAEVKGDMTFGVNFVAPIKYTLNYSVVGDESQGAIAVTPIAASGSAIAAGTEMTVTVQGADGYCVSEVKYTSGTKEKTYSFTAADAKKSVSGTFTMEANTTITASFIPCVCAEYTDVTDSDWFHRAAAFAVSGKLMEGYSAAQFAPNDKATRAQIVTILYRMAGSPDVATNATFHDVPANAWYAKAVAWAEDCGIAKGMTETRFAPNNNVTREQIVTFFYRYALIHDLVIVDGSDLSRFNDGHTVSDYAEKSMAWAVKTNLIIGMDNKTLEPGGLATRAQIATILMRFAKLH